jgi:hypothetical protein
MIELGTVPMQTGIEDHGPTGSTAACAALLSGRQSTTESSADPAPVLWHTRSCSGPVTDPVIFLFFSCYQSAGFRSEAFVFTHEFLEDWCFSAVQRPKSQVLG